MQNLLRVLLTLIMFGVLPAAFAIEGESIVFDPATGNYLITNYSGIDKKFEKLIFIPATKINPAIRVKLKRVREGEIHYGYTLTSGQDSQQDIVLLILDPVSSVTTPMPDVPLDAPAGQIAIDMLNVANYFDTPALWDASMAYSDARKSFRIGWSTKVVNGMHPGGQVVFGLKSHDLPGIIQAEVYGYAPGSQEIDGEELPDAEDGGFGQQYFALVHNDFLHRPLAVPTISITKPFDGISVLKQIKTNILTWPDMKLVDATTATSIGTSLQSAIDALGGGNKEAAIKTLRSIRLNHMLSNDKPDSDKGTLHGKKDAAKNSKDHKATEEAEANRKLVEDVLEFDLKYVVHALDSDEKEDEIEAR